MLLADGLEASQLACLPLLYFWYIKNDWVFGDRDGRSALGQVVISETLLSCVRLACGVNN